MRNTLFIKFSSKRQQYYIDKVYLYAKNLQEPKYQFLIKKREQAGIKNLKDPNAFIQHSDTMGDIYDNINDYNKKKKNKSFNCV